MTRLYVGNLPWTSSEKDITDFFKFYGFSTERVKIITERETGRSRGFAFVDLKHDQNAVIAACDGQALGERALRVSPAERKKVAASPHEVMNFGDNFNNRR